MHPAYDWANVSSDKAPVETRDWPRPVVHWEIVVQDAGRQAEFYRKMFNWPIGDGAVMAIPAGLGGPEPGPAGHLRVGDHPGVRLYVQVQDVPRSLELAEALGGKRVREPFSNAGGVTLGLILDPEGNPIVLVQQ